MPKKKKNLFKVLPPPKIKNRDLLEEFLLEKGLSKNLLLNSRFKDLLENIRYKCSIVNTSFSLEDCKEITKLLSKRIRILSENEFVFLYKISKNFTETINFRYDDKKKIYIIQYIKENSPYTIKVRRIFNSKGIEIKSVIITEKNNNIESFYSVERVKNNNTFFLNLIKERSYSIEKGSKTSYLERTLNYDLQNININRHFRKRKGIRRKEEIFNEIPNDERYLYIYKLKYKDEEVRRKIIKDYIESNEYYKLPKDYEKAIINILIEKER